MGLQLFVTSGHTSHCFLIWETVKQSTVHIAILLEGFVEGKQSAATPHVRQKLRAALDAGLTGLVGGSADLFGSFHSFSLSPWCLFVYNLSSFVEQ